MSWTPGSFPSEILKSVLPHKQLDKFWSTSLFVEKTNSRNNSLLQSIWNIIPQVLDLVTDLFIPLFSVSFLTKYLVIRRTVVQGKRQTLYASVNWALLVGSFTFSFIQQFPILSLSSFLSLSISCITHCKINSLGGHLKLTHSRSHLPFSWDTTPFKAWKKVQNKRQTTSFSMMAQTSLTKLESSKSVLWFNFILGLKLLLFLLFYFPWFWGMVIIGLKQRTKLDHNISSLSSLLSSLWFSLSPRCHNLQCASKTWKNSFTKTARMQYSNATVQQACDQALQLGFCFDFFPNGARSLSFDRAPFKSKWTRPCLGITPNGKPVCSRYRPTFTSNKSLRGSACKHQKLTCLIFTLSFFSFSALFFWSTNCRKKHEMKRSKDNCMATEGASKGQSVTLTLRSLVASLLFFVVFNFFSCMKGFIPRSEALSCLVRTIPRSCGAFHSVWRWKIN